MTNGIRAYVSQDYNGFSIRIALVRVEEPHVSDVVTEGHLIMPRPTHVLSLTETPFHRKWTEITDRLVQQDPTLLLSEEEARAMFLALKQHFGKHDQEPQPVLVVHVGGKLGEDDVRTLRRQIRRALDTNIHES